MQKHAVKRGVRMEVCAVLDVEVVLSANVQPVTMEINVNSVGKVTYTLLSVFRYGESVFQ